MWYLCCICVQLLKKYARKKQNMRAKYKNPRQLFHCLGFFKLRRRELPRRGGNARRNISETAGNCRSVKPDFRTDIDHCDFINKISSGNFGILAPQIRLPYGALKLARQQRIKLRRQLTTHATAHHTISSFLSVPGRRPAVFVLLAPWRFPAVLAAVSPR